MTVCLDTTVFIDFLRGHAAANRLILGLEAPPLASELCRVEVLQGLRPEEQKLADDLFRLIDWIPVVELISTRAGELGRQWRPSHSGIGIADLVIAATAELTDSRLLTRNVKHFPMIQGLRPAY